MRVLAGKRIASSLLAVSLLFGVIPGAWAESGVVAKFDFEEFDAGADLKGTTGWEVKLYEGDSCTVEVEPVSGSKAIKFVKAKTTEEAYMEYSLPKEITSGLIKVSYDARIASATKYILCFGGIRDKNWSNLIGPRIKGVSLFDGDSPYIGAAKDGIGKDWCHYEYLIDLQNKTLDYKVYKNNTEIMSYKKTNVTKDNVRRIIFNTCEDHSWGVNAWEATYPAGSKIPNAADPDGVIYLDNLTFETIGLEVKGTTPKDKSKNVSVDSEISFDFNIAPSDISEKLEVLKDGEKIEAGASVSGTKSIINITGGLFYGSEYEITLKAGALPATAGIDSLAKDYSFSFETESIIPEITGIADGGFYDETVSAEFAAFSQTSLKAELSKDGGEFAEYLSREEISEIGKYQLKFTAEKNGKSQVKIISFEIVEQVAPRTEEVVISKEGLVLTGSYKYVDDNGDDEDKENTGLRWLRADTIDGEYKEIAKGAAYTITEADLDKFVKFGVIPWAKEYPYEGKEYLSEALLMPSKPVVTGDVTLSGEMKVGAVLTAGYQYYDKNDDKEKGTLFSWYRCNENGGNKIKIEGAAEKTYTITESDADCYITCGVAPKNDSDFGAGDEYFAKPVMGLYSPEAMNVEISGKAGAGRSVGASYTFTDKNLDKEGESKIEWFLNGVSVSNDAGYQIPKSSSGILTLRVTPVSEEFPYEGKTVEVTANISKVSSVGSGGGSGSSGGFSVSSGGGVMNVTPTPEIKEEEKAPEVTLNDISSHWAEGSVKKLFKKGIITGDEKNNFNPNKKIARAEIAALIVRALDLEEEYKKLYTDVLGDEWYAEIVCAVSSAGIMKGNGMSFRANDVITREELCVVLVNALRYGRVELGSGDISFKDRDEISTWAREAVEIAVSMGLIEGIGENILAPKSSATKAQAAVILDKMLGEMED